MKINEINIETRYMTKDEIEPFIGKWVEIEFGPAAVLLEKHIYRGELTGVPSIDLMELYLHDGHGSCVSGGFNHIIRIEEVERREDEYGW